MKLHLRTLPLALALLASTLLHAQDCTYTLHLFAADGNGWGGSYVTVCTGASAPLDCYDHTLAAGGADEVLIQVNISEIITVSYTAVGGDQNAIYFRLDLAGSPLFNSWSPPLQGLIFAVTVDCTPPPAPVADCLGAYTLIYPVPVTANWLTNIGWLDELNESNQGCLELGETSGVWYNFGYSEWPYYYSGEMAFTITPTQPANYDFAVWGPFPYGTPYSSICPPPGEPFRCSYAETYGPTGLSFSATETTQDATGDGFVAPVDNSTGVFLLYVGRKDGNDHQYTITWNLSTGEEHILEVGNRQLQLQPNPADLHTTVFLPGSNEALHTLEVVDALGRQVLQAPVPRSSAHTGVPLALYGLASGTYLVLARDAHGALLGHARLLKH